jgi:hypothetical protein
MTTHPRSLADHIDDGAIKVVTHSIVERKVGDLWVDPQVQRAVKKSRVEGMAGAFRADALGVLTTSFRSADRIHIIDGQHRYRAAEAAGYEGVIQTMEYRGLTIPEEAALFRLLNKTEKVSPIDQFLISCVEQQPDSLALARILRDNGWTLANSASTGKLSAIRSLERIYAASPTAAAATIATLTAAFGHTPNAVQGSMIEGLGKVLAKYGDAVDLTDLAKRLAISPGGADGIVGFARGQKLARVGNLSHQVAWAITNLYNQRRRTTALPEWR